ncbi:hypothetical protein HU200_066071 [Digitaria exilis]|uniref:Uncharacterized protein n=1 Tax=Digitaria exilis TaxID=1010633 RepID=A0A835DXC6_9POAL|nr:hypothetical protein HU200_066071 [Digitaria exilis]
MKQFSRDGHVLARGIGQLSPRLGTARAPCGDFVNLEDLPAQSFGGLIGVGGKCVCVYVNVCGHEFGQRKKSHRSCVLKPTRWLIAWVNGQPWRLPSLLTHGAVHNMTSPSPVRRAEPIRRLPPLNLPHPRRAGAILPSFKAPFPPPTRPREGKESLPISSFARGAATKAPVFTFAAAAVEAEPSAMSATPEDFWARGPTLAARSPSPPPSSSTCPDAPPRRRRRRRLLRRPRPPFISRMLMEEDIDDKFFYQSPTTPRSSPRSSPTPRSSPPTTPQPPTPTPTPAVVRPAVPPSRLLHLLRCPASAEPPWRTTHRALPAASAPRLTRHRGGLDDFTADDVDALLLQGQAQATHTGAGGEGQLDQSSSLAAQNAAGDDGSQRPARFLGCPELSFRWPEETKTTDATAFPGGDGDHAALARPFQRPEWGNIDMLNMAFLKGMEGGQEVKEEEEVGRWGYYFFGEEEEEALMAGPQETATPKMTY